MATKTAAITLSSSFSSLPVQNDFLLGNLQIINLGDVFTEATATHFVASDSVHGLAYEVSGSGFTYEHFGGSIVDIVGGTMTKAVLMDGGTTIFTVTFSPGQSMAAFYGDPTAGEIEAALGQYAYTFNGWSDADIFNGFGLNDTIRGFGGNDVLGGNAGNDTLDGGTGADVLRGGADNDIYVVDNPGDIVNELFGGDDGFDTIQSSRSLNLYDEAHVKGTVEKLVLLAGATNGAGDSSDNVLVGNSAANTLRGYQGNDILNGAGGNDFLIGGAGSDAFVFTAALGATTNKDTIDDFNVLADTIRLDNAVFTKLAGAAGTTLSANQFFKGPAAHDADDHIIYRAATGALYYDADGNKAGGVAAVQFATLDAGLALTSADFLII